MALSAAYLNLISSAFSSAPIEKTKLPFLANTKWEADAENATDVRIIKVATPSVGTYDPTSDITYAAYDASSITLAADQKRYFANTLDDTIKLVGGYVDAYVAKGEEVLALEGDKYVLAMATSANFPTNKIAGTLDAAVLVDSTTVLDVLETVSVKLDDANVPAEGRFVVVTPTIASSIRKAVVGKGLSLQPSGDALFAGKCDKVSGLNIVVSNQVYSPTAGEYNLFFGTADAIAQVVRPASVEEIRLQGRFASAIRSLFVFGAKIVDEKFGGVIRAKLTA